MATMGLMNAAQLLDGHYNGPDLDFGSVSTDTRSLLPGDVFVALKGPNFDGHGFVDKARNSGAIAAVISDSVDVDMPLITVGDTGKALMKLAQEWRRQHPIPTVAITGSNGKTTVKEMVAAILSCRGKVLATRGNFNNEIGLPLTLFRLSDDDEYAVLELGASALGEIGRLVTVAMPQVAVLTNAGPAHLQGFGSIDRVATAKGEIFSTLTAGDTAIINADDVYAPQWRDTVASDVNILTFGWQGDADVHLRDQALATRLVDGAFETRFGLAHNDEAVDVILHLAGLHNVSNALAAAAACLALGVDLKTIVRGLKQLLPVSGRLAPLAGRSGAQIIDDSYNANPGSVDAAIKLLAACQGERWLVLGDMGDLGQGASELHHDIGVVAREMGIDRLYACGTLSAHAVSGFGDAGHHFDSREALVAALQPQLGESVVLLVKGSRSAAMDRVVTALSAEPTGEGC